MPFLSWYCNSTHAWSDLHHWQIVNSLNMFTHELIYRKVHCKDLITFMIYSGVDTQNFSSNTHHLLLFCWFVLALELVQSTWCWPSLHLGSIWGHLALPQSKKMLKQTEVLETAELLCCLVKPWLEKRSLNYCFLPSESKKLICCDSWLSCL